MICIGDKIAGINKAAECYRSGECGETGCEKCRILCTGCENCQHLSSLKPRDPEVGDFVFVHQKLCGATWPHTWQPTMDEAIGRIGYAYEGNKRDGYKIKFTTTNSDVLSQFFFPPESLKLAMPGDVQTDKMIKNVKDNPADLNSGVI